MNYFNKLKGFQRSPAGLEWQIWKRLHLILAAGTVLPLLASAGAYVLDGLEPATQNSRAVEQFFYVMLGVVILHWTLVLTLAIGCAIVMFGMTTVAGIQELSRVQFEGTRNGIIVAVSVSVGVLPMSFPSLFAQAHGPLKLLLESGIFLGALTAIVLNLLLNPRMSAAQELAAQAGLGD